ncbi:MAG: type I-C CRISPR-associated protein Cas8c/Csd1 [Gammaproteobacteria bacterium]|nr:type I-C CRISPR-associated protein Cas8c/Csd1 [Gammaproteobacteria bacterium]
MTVLQALAGLHERLSATGEAPAFGFSRENISYAILIPLHGAGVDVQDIRDTSETVPRPGRQVVPRPVKRTGQPLPNFLWDKTAFALGVKRDSETRELVPAEREHAAFGDFHRRLLADCDDDAVRAFLRFLDRWRPDDYQGLRHADEMLDANVVFRLDGELGFLHDRTSVKRIWSNHLEESGGAEGRCLVTGERASIARLHPSVKGIAGAQSSGASIVSFDKDAFRSFGKERGANAPVSERVAVAYTTALNTLLERGSSRRIQIGDTTTVFWAEARGGDRRAARGEDLFSLIVDPPPPTDSQEEARVRDRLTAIAEGRPLAEVDPELDGDTRFYVLGLAPNAARVSLRFWCESTIGDIYGCVVEHWRDLWLDPPPWRHPPGVWRLLRETAFQRKTQNIPPTFGGALMRAILSGGRYPQSLLAAIVSRMRADRDISGMRAAICKACLARDHRLGHQEEGVPVGLNRDERSPAYRLGRLFAIYESVQRMALGQVNATIKDRYFGAASATPASVFPLLERNSASHLAALRKGDKGGLAHWFDGQIDDILSGLDTAFPRSLSLADQGRFAIGYHHQRESRRSPDGETSSADANGSAVESGPNTDQE